MAQTPTVDITEGVQPAATVHDTYVRPATPPKSPLWDVVQSLGTLNSRLGGMFDALDAQDQKNQEAKAVSDFYANNQEGAAEATRNGDIPTFANPHYTAAYKKIEGDNLGIRLAGQLSLSYEQSGIKASAEPDAFESWFRQSVHDQLGDIKDPGVLRGLAPRLHALHSSLYASHVKNRSDYVAGVAQDKAIGLAGTIIDQSLVDGAYKPEGYSLDNMGGSLQSIRDTMYSSGMARDQVNKVFIDTITGKALVNKDARLLDLMDRVKDENGIPMSSTEYGKMAKFKYSKDIAGLQRQDASQAHAIQVQADKALKDRKTAEFFQELRKNPSYQPSEEWLQEMEKVDPDFSKGMAAARQALLDGNKVQDPAVETNILADIYSGKGAQSIREAWGRGDIKDPNVFSKLMSEQEKYTKQAAEGPSFLQQPGMKFLIGQITARGVAKGIPTIFGKDPSLTDDARRAIQYANQKALEWSLANPDKARDPVATQQFLNGLTESVLRNFNLPEEMKPDQSGSATFKVPGTAGSLGPDGKPLPATAPKTDPGFRSTVAPPPPPPAPPKGWAETLRDSPTPPTIGDFKAWPEREAAIRAQAKKEGISPDQKVSNMWNALQRLKQQGVIKPPTSSGAPAPGPQGDNAAPRTQNPASGPTGDKRSELDVPGFGKVNVTGLSPEGRAALRQVGLNVTDTEQQVASVQEQPSSTTTNQGGISDMGKHLSEKFEVGDKGNSGTISYDGTGGWSYGRKQFAAGGSVANGSAVRTFISTLKEDAPDLASKLEAAGGASAAKAGSAEFKSAWKEAAKDPRFAAAEDKAATKELVQPALDNIKKRVGLDLSKRSNAVQEVLYSTAIQHGGAGAARLWQNALHGKDPEKLSDKELINLLYAERGKVDIYFRSSTAAIKRAVANRFVQERKDALALLASEGTDSNVG